MNVGDVMDEVAARVALAPSLAGRVSAYPPGRIVPPWAVVCYPVDGTFDKTYRRGLDSMTAIVMVHIGRPTERQSRDALTGYLDGAGPESMRVLLDDDGPHGDYASCSAVSVTDWATDTFDIAGIPYLTAIFQLDIAGPGSA